MEDNFGSFQVGSQPSQAEPTGSFDKVYDECKPKVIIIFLTFAFIPILMYLLLGTLTDQHFATFLVTALLLCADFWVTKNIAGRQLAALFWYSRLTEDNEQKWCFESSKKIVASSCNVLFFWFTQLVTIVFWLIALIVNLFLLDFFFVFLDLFCVLLLLINFILFLECKGQHQKKVNSLTRRFGKQVFELNQEK